MVSSIENVFMDVGLKLYLMHRIIPVFIPIIIYIIFIYKIYASYMLYILYEYIKTLYITYTLYLYTCNNTSILNNSETLSYSSLKIAIGNA